MTQSSPLYDLLLKGGHVIDPANGIDGPIDVAISGGRIVAVERDLPGAQAVKTLPVQGLYVTPGLIDLHSHFYGGGGGFLNFELDADQYAIPNGTTTVVDAGGPGWTNFGGFRDRVIVPSTTRVLALLNIAAAGMNSDREQDVKELQIEACAETINEFRQHIVGIKSAHYKHPGWESVDAAVKAGEMAGVPVMVDSWPSPVRSYRDMLMEHLRPGDIHTHFYARQFPVLDETKKVSPFMWEARKRGVIFDIGHGGGSYWFRIAAPAMEQGFGPDTISTDAHKSSLFMSRATMPITMSKLMSIGMPLKEAVERATSVPARVIHRRDLGAIGVGAEADVAVFELEEGEFGFVDSGLARMTGDRRLSCRLTIRAGRVVWDTEGISRPAWRTQGEYIRTEG